MDVENRSIARPPLGAVDPDRIPAQASVPVGRQSVPPREGDGLSPSAGARRPPEVPARAEPVHDVEGVPPPPLAGVVTRLIAAVVDAAAVAVVAVALDLGAAAARFLWSPRDFSWPHPSTVVIVEVLLGVAVVYLTVGWSLAGRTYGERLMGLRVLSSRFELMGWGRSGLRALVCVIWPVGLVWCGVSRTRRSLADLLLRTAVVYDVRPFASVRSGAATSNPRPAA